MSDMLPIEISVQEVDAMLQRGDDFLLVDVRELPEYQTASIPGATLIPLNQLQSSLDQLEPFRDKRIVVHCHHGGRSFRATMALRGLGFEKTQNMSGGIDQWSQEINPQVPRY